MAMMILLYALLGFLVGVFLNLCADQLPRWRRLRRAPFCPFCDQPRPAWAWISTLAFLRFRSTCQSCDAPISWRHPLVELGTAVLYGFLWYRYALPGEWVFLLLFTVYSTIFILVIVIDLEHRLILNIVMYPAWLLALLGSFIHPAPYFYRRALLGGALGFAILFLVYLGGILFVKVLGRIRGKSIHAVAFGFIGLALGFPDVLTALFAAVFLGGLVGLLYLLISAAILRRYRLFTAIPYGPFLVLGAMYVMFAA
jgi:leader peptidase (prepilin peptidase)/N-methyltransferase